MTADATLFDGLSRPIPSKIFLLSGGGDRMNPRGIDAEGFETRSIAIPWGIDHRLAEKYLGSISERKYKRRVLGYEYNAVWVKHT